MVEKFLMCAGYPFSGTRLPGSLKPIEEYEELRRIQEKEKTRVQKENEKMNPEAMKKEIVRLSLDVTQIENWLKGLGYPKSEVYVDGNWNIRVK